MMKKLALSLIAIGFSANLLASAFNEPEAAITYRQANFQMIRGNFAAMAEMVKGQTAYDQQAFARYATNLAQLSQMPTEAFKVAGSDKGETGARAEVWSDWAGFEAKMTQFQQDAEALRVAAASGDEGASKQAFAAAAKNCKSCHESYKKD